MPRTRPIVLVLALLLGLASTATAGVRDERRTLIGSEILGRGGFITFNLEYFLNNNFGLGGGILAAGNGDGGFLILPLYVSVVPGDVHSVYLGAGLTMFAGTDFGDTDSFTVFTASAGYQYHSYGGLFVRPTFTLMIATENTTGDTAEAILWPGVAIGGSF